MLKVITGYLLAGSIIGPGGFSFVTEMVQVETVAQFGVIFLLFALGLEFSAAKLRVVRAVAILGGVSLIFLFMFLRGVTASDCTVGLLFAFLPVLGGTSVVLQGVISMSKSLLTLISFLSILWILTRTLVPRFLKLMISLSSQTNDQLAYVAFCLLVAWCSDKLGLSLELGSFAAGVMISTTDLAQHTLEQIEPIRNFFAALFLASIGMLIHVHFLWNHVDILLAAVILVIIIKTIVVAIVVKAFGYNNKTSLLVGMSLAQIGEFAFVLLSRASNLHLVGGKVYLLLLGTTALSLVTTPLLFKLIPAVVHLGVLLRWFTPDSSSEDKYLQKLHFFKSGIPLPEFREIHNFESAKRAGELYGYPLMIKSKRLAYDGRGNAVAKSDEDIPSAVTVIFEDGTKGKSAVEVYPELSCKDRGGEAEVLDST
ncbi:K(+) efflux antiporter 4-like [Amaranthus tricolor]|uniref:K(+) efflux antiporter 4-like n=1 Tax=Amaranthus tricolor TaxID=29722 RepID=UPI002585F855|nr:K(+) efflux antiporter 4-like [Amaranthus tricolor]